jgi:predicted subunit of tRNA(5-methylaminomethyl-2-thiouridylate) methyltransferase
MRTFEEIKASMKNRKPTIFSEIAENELRYNKGVKSKTTMRTFEEILESIKDIDLMFDDELMNEFINEKEINSSANLYNLLNAGSLREDDICDLSANDIRNIVDYVNVRYDIDLKVVGHKVLWNS